MLRERGVSPTAQRIAIALELLPKPTHLSAEEITRRVALRDDNVSRATVYNTLRCFVENGLIRQVNVGAERVFYDSNTGPHHHFYDPENGELTDIDSTDVSILTLPKLPEGREAESVDLVIRLKPTGATR
ncbi:MAG: transcriptional repressor [Proteobacteria bacterium]|nr:MAG: transcriptional repressor [Pseudomonadota bacterium]